MTTTKSDFSEEEQKQLKAFIEILDQAYLSENSAVKDALHKLMMITILCHGHKKSKRGPFKELFKKIEHLENKLNDLEFSQDRDRDRSRDLKDYDQIQKIIDGYRGSKYGTPDSVKIHPWTDYLSTTDSINTLSPKDSIDALDSIWTTTNIAGSSDYLPDEVTDQLTKTQLHNFFTHNKINNEK